MADPNDFVEFAALASIVIFVVAAWSLQRRLRNRASRWFAVMVTLLAAWPFVSMLATNALLTYGNPAEASPVTNWAFVILEVFLPATVLLASASCFWLAVRTVASQSVR